MKTKFMPVVLLLAALLMLPLINGEARAELTAKANHDHILVDFFYHGSTVSVRGVADKGTDLVITIAPSQEGHEGLLKKGKVLGALWMNVGPMTFEHVPIFYSVHSSRKLDEMLTAEERDKYGLGYEAIGHGAEIKPAVKDEAEKARWFGEFLKYKEKSHLYAASTGNIEIKEQDGKQTYFIQTQWPFEAKAGDYVAKVYAVKDGHVVEEASSSILVEQAGVVKYLSGMAKNNSSLYGLLSIGVAIAAGFGVGLVFRKGGGAH